MQRQQPTTAELTIMIAGAAMLVGSFLDFYSGGGSTAWSRSVFPVAALLPLYGGLMAGQIALTKLAGVTLPRRIGTFSWEQIHLALGLLTVLLVLCFVSVSNPGLGVGALVELLAAGGLVSGAVLLQKERNTGVFR